MKQKITDGIFLKDSNKPGNTTTIMVGVHGNEISGIESLDELIDDLEIISGKVYFIYANINAIKQNARYTEKNLNRCFLKDNSNKTYEEKRAREIIQYLDKSDFLLDIHNTISFNSSLEFLITTHTNYSKYFDIERVVTNIDDIQKGGSDGYMDSIGKKGFCIECGSINFGDKQRSKSLAKKSILNFLKVTGNIAGEATIYDNKVDIIKMDYMYKLKTNNFNLSKEFADFEDIKSGITIATDGDEKVLNTKDSVIIFARNRNNTGDEGFCIGIRQK